MPVLLIETGSVVLVPTLTLPKLRAVGLGFNCPYVETAVADSGTASGELDAVPVIATWPLAVPALAAAKLTDMETLCPGPRLTGTGSPLTLKPEPVKVSWEIVALAVPVLVTIRGSAVVVPIVTLPKLRLLGFGVSCPDPVVAETVTPVPVTATLIVELEALLPSDKVAFDVPATVGVKVTLKTALWPGPKLNGRDGPARLNPEPVSVA